MHQWQGTKYARPVANVFEPDWDAEQDRPPFTWRRSRVGRQAGAERLGASLFELPPGCSTFPLHVHHANEEMLLVVAGTPTLRTLEGERELAPGELVAFPAGDRGGHRIDNRSDAPVRVLMVSTMNAPEVNTYPDSGKVWVRDYPPGGEPGDEPSLDAVLRADATVHYLEGER
jgi:uncharacterized cupin superfamily protein